MAKLVAMPARKKEKDIANDLLKEEVRRYQIKLKNEPFRQENFQRLMILYRKLKDPVNELKVIESAMKAFEGLYNSARKRDQEVATVSKKLNMAFGLTDKKGNALYEQEPLSTWRKRKQTVLSRLYPKKN